MTKTGQSNHWIKFLGTAGARFVMIRQLRASGGLWIKSGNVNVLIDPGPGCIARCAASRPKLDPSSLDAIILTHRHLDHSNDMNVMIEAMTEGGFKKRGIVFVPEDALNDDPVILKYAQKYIAKIEFLKENKTYQVQDFTFRTTIRLKHPSETYGIRFKSDKKEVALLTDTQYFNGIEEHFKADVLIINTVFYEQRPGVEHLGFEDAKKIILNIKPQKAVLTHFGMSMLKAGPHALAKAFSWETGMNVVAATDGMVVDF